MILKKVLFYVHKYNKNAWYIRPTRETVFISIAVSFWIALITTILCFLYHLISGNKYPGLVNIIVPVACFFVLEIMAFIADVKYSPNEIDKAYDMEFEKSFRIKAQLFVGIPWLLMMIMGIAGLVFLIFIMIKANHH